MHGVQNRFFPWIKNQLPIWFVLFSFNCVAGTVTIKGNVSQISKNPDGTDFIRLNRVTGPIPGRFLGVSVKVELCANGQCLAYDPATVKVGKPIQITGSQKSDFILTPPLSIEPFGPSSPMALELIQGEVVSVTPPFAGWQWLGVQRSANDIIYAQICADYASGPRCPILQGAVREPGKFVVLSATKLDLFHYFKTESVAVQPQANLKLSLNPVDFGSMALGSTKQLTTTLQNTGDLATGFQIGGTPANLVLTHNCPEILSPGESCDLQLAFTSQLTGQFEFPISIVYASSNHASLLDLVIRGMGVEGGPRMVEFHIPPGTQAGAWNTEQTAVRVKLGDTLRIINDDSRLHQLCGPSNGMPCPHPSKPMKKGEYYDCVISKALPLGPTLYDHLYGPDAKFWFESIPQQ